MAHSPLRVTYGAHHEIREKVIILDPSALIDHVVRIGDFGGLGFDDPEPTHRVEMTDRGMVIGTNPEALHRRASHIVALIFEKIPEAIKAGVMTSTGQNQNGSWGFDLAGRPLSMKPSDVDLKVIRKAFFDKAGWGTSGDGTICGVCIRNPKEIRPRLPPEACPP